MPKMGAVIPVCTVSEIACEAGVTGTSGKVVPTCIQGQTVSPRYLVEATHSGVDTGWLMKPSSNRLPSWKTRSVGQ